MKNDSSLFDNRREYLFAGESNAGKSSLINKLFKEKVAIVSHKPVKTKILNFRERPRRLRVTNS